MFWTLAIHCPILIRTITTECSALLCIVGVHCLSLAYTFKVESRVDVVTLLLLLELVQWILLIALSDCPILIRTLKELKNFWKESVKT